MSTYRIHIEEVLPKDERGYDTYKEVFKQTVVSEKDSFVKDVVSVVNGLG